MLPASPMCRCMTKFRYKAGSDHWFIWVLPCFRGQAQWMAFEHELSKRLEGLF